MGKGRVDLNTGLKREGFIRGYTLAAQSKGRYSEADLEAAVAFGITLERFKDDKGRLSNDEEFKGFKESLNQPPQEIEIEIEIEMEEKTHEDIQRELGTYGHDEGLTQFEYDEYVSKNSILKPVTYKHDGKTYLKIKQ
jgi:hypothetical protein